MLLLDNKEVILSMEKFNDSELSRKFVRNKFFGDVRAILQGSSSYGEKAMNILSLFEEEFAEMDIKDRAYVGEVVMSYITNDKGMVREGELDLLSSRWSVESPRLFQSELLDFFPQLFSIVGAIDLRREDFGRFANVVDSLDLYRLGLKGNRLEEGNWGLDLSDRLPGLLYLDARVNSIESEEIELLSGMIDFDSLTHANFGHNRIDDYAVETLVELKEPGLTYLNFSHNQIRSGGVSLLVDSGWIDSLRFLDLRCNYINFEAAQRLADCPGCRTLETLLLDGNQQIGPRGWELLRTSPNTKHLFDRRDYLR